MMRILHSYILFIAVIWLSSCVPITAITSTDIASPSPISVSPIFTISPTKTETLIPTHIPTLTPLQANEKITSYLQTTVDCPSPCFWGITPKQTTLTEGTNIFASLGLQPEKTNMENNQEFYYIDYFIEKELDIGIVLAVQNSIIKTLSIGMNIYAEGGTPRKWSAYSPETLIQRYGFPSRVDFTLGRVSPNPSHTMALYFENVDMVIMYLGRWDGFLKNSKTLELCPLTNKVDYISFWMGDEPRYPPTTGVPLEQATSLTIEEFTNLMIGDPNKACFKLKDEAFP